MTIHNFCTHCGAPLTHNADFCGSCGARATGPIVAPAVQTPGQRQRYKIVGADTIAMPALVFYAAATSVLALALFLLVLVLYGAIGHAWQQSQHGSSVAFHNTTDTLLCYGHADCSAPITPRDTSYWAMDCYSSSIGEVSIYTPQGRLLYARTEDCHDWTGEFVVINEREGEFIIADSLNITAEAPARSD